MLKPSPRNSSGRRNFIAACVTVFSVGVLYSSFDAVPAGEDVSISQTVPTISFDELSAVPTPPEAAGIPQNHEGDRPSTTESARTETETETETAAAQGAVLDSMDAIKFCTLMLQDGERFLENLKDYTVVFHKEERIGGDLQQPQSIEMKVQHAPHFAVYMKWQKGERGRQLLYSEDYEDRCLSLKFGGLKRFLPALKIDPNCANAKAESRYPVTQAGVLGMIRQILIYRQGDLDRGTGVTCVRLADQEFDQRKCYVFLMRYDSPEFCELYRKSIIMIDARYHIPVLVRNFTWATDSDGLSEEELDQATLIENYSFTGLNMSGKLVAADFSRDNPRYRM